MTNQHITLIKFIKNLDSQKKFVHLHSQTIGAVAQMVEQWTENPCVGSSILPSTTNKLKISKLRNLRTTFTHNERKVVRFSFIVATLSDRPFSRGHENGDIRDIMSLPHRI